MTYTLLPETFGSRATRSSFFGIFPIAEHSRETNLCTWKCHVEGYCLDRTKTTRATAGLTRVKMFLAHAQARETNTLHVKQTCETSLLVRTE